MHDRHVPLIPTCRTPSPSRRVGASDCVCVCVCVCVYGCVREHGLCEFFLEGTRSRTGLTLSPKKGLLGMAMELLYDGQVPDLWLVRTHTHTHTHCLRHVPSQTERDSVPSTQRYPMIGSGHVVHVYAEMLYTVCMFICAYVCLSQVPVSISYERVLEGNTFPMELLGACVCTVCVCVNLRTL